MKTASKTVRVIPYGRLIDRTQAFAPAGVGHPLHVSKTWKRLPKTHEQWHLLVVFSNELDEKFVRTFRKRAMPTTRLLVLNNSRLSDRLLSRMVDLQIRSPHRFYVVDPPFAQTKEENWDQLIRSFLERLTAALESQENDGRIFDARLENGILYVVSADFRRLEVPISKIETLAKADRETTERFEIDEDGSYLYWPDLDLHLGWEQFRQVVDPAAVQRAKQKNREFNVRYGAAIRRVREDKGLAISAIPGLSHKQLRRIERGECRLTASAARKLAQAQRMTPNEYLQALGAALDDPSASQEREPKPLESAVRLRPCLIMSCESSSPLDKLRLDQLPNELRTTIVQTLASFVIPLFLDTEPAGNGVLVEVDGVLGILTAEHVIFNPDKPLEKGQVLWTIPRAYPMGGISGPANHPSATRIRTDLLCYYPSSPSRKNYNEKGAEWGPDLGFIRIPKNTNFERNLRALRNIYSWAREPELRMEKALKQSNTILAAVGGPQEWMKDDPTLRPGQVIKRTIMGIYLTAQERCWPDRNGYDFIDSLAERIPDTPIPRSFRGISGGALWRLRDPFHADPPMRELTVRDYVLAGIIFWEDQQDANAPFIRSHGPRSLYEKFLPEVRAWLKQTEKIR